MPTEPPLTLEKARAEGRMVEFIRQQGRRYPEGTDKAALRRLLGGLATPDKPQPEDDQTSPPDRDAG